MRYRAREMEAELRLYWDAMNTAWDLFREHGVLCEEIDACRDEVEAIAENTDWPLLRRICLKTIKRDDEWRMSERRNAQIRQSYG